MCENLEACESFRKARVADHNASTYLQKKKIGHLLMLGHETLITFIFKGYQRKDTICATHVVMIANIAMIEPNTLSCKSVMVAIPTPTSSVTSES
jgi:hypothetical protein